MRTEGAVRRSRQGLKTNVSQQALTKTWAYLQAQSAAKRGDVTWKFSARVVWAWLLVAVILWLLAHAY